MWREGGDGELYTYFPPGSSANQKLCNVPPFSECNETYGASVGRGAFNYGTGGWATVAQRVKLNDVGQSNGELELWVNGKSVISVKGLVMRVRESGKIRGIQFQTFFGGELLSFPPFPQTRWGFVCGQQLLTLSPSVGSTSAWASPKDQEAYFSDFSVAITESF